MKQAQRVFFTRNLSLVFLVALFLSVPAALRADDPRPPMWRVYGPDAQIYLLGTFHLLPPEMQELPAHVVEALERSDRLILEVAPDELEGEEFQGIVAQLGVYPLDRSLEADLDEDLFRKVVAAGVEFGILPNQMSRFRPWYAGLILTTFAMMDAGLDPEAGVEATLTQIARRGSLSVEGLESARSQLEIMADMSLDEQIVLLEDSLNDIQRAGEDLHKTADGWRSGNDQLLEGLLDSFLDSPDAYESFFVERHDAWIPQLKDLLDSAGGTSFVAVGALHMYGPDALPERLEALGFSVERHGP